MEDETITMTSRSRNARRKSKILDFLSENSLILSTLAGIIVGFCVGFGLQTIGASPDVLVYVGIPGELFIRSLKATIVPIVVCMAITSTSTMDAGKNGRMAVIACIIFFVTHVIAVMTATVLFLVLRPEANSLNTGSYRRNIGTKLKTQDVFLDLIRNFIPDNIVGATIYQATTIYTEEENQVFNSTTNLTETVMKYERSVGQASGVNILGLVMICFAIGAAANKKLHRDSAFLAFFRQGQEVTLLVMHWLAWTTPVGAASLVAKSIAGVSSFGTVFSALARLVICVISGLGIHHLVTMPAILFILSRKNPFLFLARCMKAYFVSFAACGTSVALPQMLEACSKNKVSGSVSKFVIPMSVTLHADGSALYIASASLFVAQTTGVENIAIQTVLVIACLSTVLSMALPPVPSASIVTIVIILTSLNVPLQGVALLFTMEWILDRLRTGVNATTHILCAAFTDAICGRQSSEDAPIRSCKIETEDEDRAESDVNNIDLDSSQGWKLTSENGDSHYDKFL